MTRWGDIDVAVSPLLPYRPSPGEVGRRIARHGLADVLTWLGQPVGPAPDAATHVVQLRPGQIIVSREVAHRLVVRHDVRHNRTVIEHRDGLDPWEPM